MEVEHADFARGYDTAYRLETRAVIVSLVVAVLDKLVSSNVRLEYVFGREVVILNVFFVLAARPTCICEKNKNKNILSIQVPQTKKIAELIMSLRKEIADREPRSAAAFC